jgi:hypothetical protein
MKRLLLVLAAGLVAVGADDPWAKVKDLKSGSELKLWKKGTSQPIDAIYDDLGEEKLLVVVKNEQMSIPREGIDRIDARASTKKDKPKVESTVQRDINNPSPVAAPPRDQKSRSIPGDTTSASTSVSWSKSNFETVYRRMPAPPPPAKP